MTQALSPTDEIVSSKDPVLHISIHESETSSQSGEKLNGAKEVGDYVPLKSKYKVVSAFKDLFNWYPKNYDEAERKLMLKLDLVILTYASLGFFVKSLDSSNVKYAYVSGMKEDLSMNGNELNWLTWMYQIGYVIGQVPGMLVISRPKYSKYLFPSLEVIFGILTFCQSRVNTIHQLYAIRFLVGLTEAPFYAGTHYTLGKWYGAESYRGNPAELYKRAGTWFASQNIANFFTGYLQAAVYKNLNGKNGLSGWQWLFLIDGVITLPIALLGFVAWPGIPEAGKPWFLKDDDFGLVRERTRRYGVKESKKLTFSHIKEALSSWHWYLFSLTYTIICIAWYPLNYFSLWLKAKGTYSVYLINILPTVSDVVAVFANIIGPTLASVYPPWSVFTISFVGPIVCGIILSVYNVPDAAVFFGYYFSYIIYPSVTILLSHANLSMKDDNEKKAIVMGSLMFFGMSIPISLSFGIYPTSNTKHPTWAAPQWKIGWPISVSLCGLSVILFWIISYLHNRDQRILILKKASGDDQDANLDDVSISTTSAA